VSELHVVHAVGLRRDVGRRLGFANADELRVVDRVLQRLELGRERYGHLDLSRPRNWRKERFEERLDALVYDVAEELAAEDAVRAQLRQGVDVELCGWEAQRRAAAGVGAAGIKVELAPADLDDDEPYAEYAIESPGGGG
jgi:hypothetical protein